MSRLALIIAGIFAVLVVGGILAMQARQGRDDGGERPRVVIVTDGMIEAIEDAAREERNLAATQQPEQRLIDDVLSAANPPRESADQKSRAGVGREKNGDAEDEEAAQTQVADAKLTAEGVNALRGMLGDQLEALLNRALTESGQFNVADASSVRSAISALIAQPAAATPRQAQPGAGEARQRSAVQAWYEGLFNTSRETGELGVLPVDVGAGDLAVAADRLQARYLLFVVLNETRHVESFAQAADGGWMFQMESDPVFVFRLYDVKDKRTLVVDVARLDAPVAVVMPALLQNAGTVQRANYRADFAKALREMTTLVQAKVTSYVASRVLAASNPPRIESLEPLALDRGERDGLRVGDRFDLFRMTQAAGRANDHLVASVEVVTLEPTRATVRALNGEAIELRDVARFQSRSLEAPEAESSSGAVPAAGGAGRGLGKEGYLAEQRAAEAGAALLRERVAVGDLRILWDDQRIEMPAQAFEKSLVARLAQEPRLELLSRESLPDLRREQALGAQRGARRSYLADSGGQPVAQAGFLILGDVSVNVATRSQVVAGAAPRSANSSYELTARANLRIERLDSRVIASFPVTVRLPVSRSQVNDYESGGRLAEAFADRAAETILPYLFPIEVVQVNGSTIVISRGADIGLKDGEMLEVFAVGPPIIDPTSKALISSGVRTAVGVMRILDVQERVSVGAVVEGAGFGVGQVAYRRDAPAPKPASTKVKQSDEATAPW